MKANGNRKSGSSFKGTLIALFALIFLFGFGLTEARAEEGEGGVTESGQEAGDVDNVIVTNGENSTGSGTVTNGGEGGSTVVVDGEGGSTVVDGGEGGEAVITTEPEPTVTTGGEEGTGEGGLRGDPQTGGGNTSTDAPTNNTVVTPTTPGLSDANPDIVQDNLETLAVTDGEAVLEEIVYGNAPSTNQLAGDPANDVDPSTETFKNDVQSITITQTYKSDNPDITNDNAYSYVPQLKPETTTYTGTISGKTLKSTDENKVETKGATVKYNVVKAADNSTAVITKTTVTKSSNAIQKAINSALKKASYDSDGKIQSITITVGKGTYNGDLNISFNNVQEVVTGANKNFTLYILGEDSFTRPAKGVIDKSTISAGAGTGVVLNGNVNIDDINVVFAGIYFSTLGPGGQTNTSAQIKKVNLLNSNNKTEIYGTAANDSVDIYIKGKNSELKVDTGKGIDKVQVTTEYNGLDAGTGFSNKLNVSTGDGADTVTLTHTAGVLEAEIYTGDGGDTVTIAGGLDAARKYTPSGGSEKTSSLKVDLGAGSDNITVNVNTARGFSKIYLYGGSDLEQLKGKYTEDKINEVLDQYISMSANLKMSGHDSLTLVGDLAKDGEISSTIKVPLYGKVVEVNDNYFGYVTALAKRIDDPFDIDLIGFNALSDSLVNKPTVEIESLKVDAQHPISSFTDYKYTGDLTDSDGKLVALNADWSGYTIVLTTLHIGYYPVKLGTFINVPTAIPDVALGNINMPTVNLSVAGKRIVVGGEVIAASVTLKAGDNDALFDFLGDGNIDPSSAPQVNTESPLSGSLFDFVATAEVEIQKGSSITAVNGNVNVSATVEQTRSLIDLFGDALAGINVINVKVGSSNISIKGNIEAHNNVNITARANVKIAASNESLAGLYVPIAVVVAVTESTIEIDDKAQIEAKLGSVKITSESKVAVNASATTGSLPLSFAVAVGVNDAHILIGEKAQIKANGNVEIINTASTTASAKATRGGGLTGNASGYIAAEVIVQDAYAKVTDQAQITATNGNVTVRSTATQNGMAVASSAKPAGDGGDSTAKQGMNSIKELFKSIAVTLKDKVKSAISNKIHGIGYKFGGKDHAIKTTKTEHGAVTAPSSANAHDFVTDKTFEAGVKYYTCDIHGVYTVANVVAGTNVPSKPAYYKDADPVVVTINPDEGYSLKTLEIKYLKKGADNYTMITPTKVAEGTYTFKMPEFDVIITAIFQKGAGESAAQGEGTDAGVTDLIDDALSGAEEEDEDIVTENSTKPDAIKVNVEYTDDNYTAAPANEVFRENVIYYKKNGDKYEVSAVEPGDTIPENTYYIRNGSILTAVTKVDAGKKIQLIINPSANKVASEVKAVYKSKYILATGKFQEGKEYFLIEDGEYKKQKVEKDKDIPKDKTYYVLSSTETRIVEELITKTNGKYIFKIPTGVNADGISLRAKFGDPDAVATGGDDSADGGDASTAQSAGALAAGVNINNNKAAISTTGTITAGGVVTVEAIGTNVGYVMADGTAVGPDAMAEEPEEQPDAGIVTSAQTIIPYTVYIEPSRGVVLQKADGTDEENGIYVLDAISFEPHFEKKAEMVTATYVKPDGTEKTRETIVATFDDTTKKYTIDLSALQIKEGTTVKIKFKDFEEGVDIEGEYLVPNSITVKSTRNGAIQHASGGPGSKIYSFKIKPAAGYRVKEKTETEPGSPYAEYIKVTGEGSHAEESTVKFELKKDDSGIYYFNLSDLTGLKPGTEIKIGAEFEANQRNVVTEVLQAGKPAGDKVPGTITIESGLTTTSPATAMETKEIVFTLTAGQDNQYAKVYIAYTDKGAEVKKELTIGEDGKYTFTMPGVDVKIIADFFRQAHTLTTGGASAGEIDLSASAAAEGQAITVSLSEEGAAAGKKITGLTVEITGGNVITEPYTDSVAAHYKQNADGTWTYTIPGSFNYLDGTVELDQLVEGLTFTFIPVTGDKALTLKPGTVANGTIEAPAFADAKEEVTIKLTPGSGYKIDSSSVKVIIIGANGSTKTVTAKGSGTIFTFVVPDSVTAGSTAEITAKFVPGVQSGSGKGKDGKQTVSVGVSVAVGVVINKNEAIVENATIVSKGLKVISTNTTQDKVEALAGFSAGQIGIGGAVAVNVDTSKSIAVVKDTAKVTLTGGPLEVTAKTTAKFDTNASAKGQDKSENAGVGAGIAVSVTGIDTKAEIEDEPKEHHVIQIAEGKKLDSVKVSATTTDTQTVGATAGAAGGISVTPVLALTVAGADTYAHIGKGTTEIITSGDLTVSAESDAWRQLAANAAAAGDSVGVGASFSISVLNDKTKARLSRSVKAKNVTVNVKAKNRVRSTSRASASGASGKSKSDDSGSSDDKAGADKQSDGPMAGAGKLAGHVNAGGTSPSGISSASGKKNGASTTEGGIEVAAALALNVQNITAEAIIDDGLSITAEGDEKNGKVIVRTQTYNEAYIAANGSASKGKIGVGVAVAVNVVSYKSNAIVGNSSVSANDITVEAVMIPETPSTVNEVPAKSKGWLMDLLENALQSLILDIAKNAGLADLFGEKSSKVLADLLTTAVDKALDSITKGTGFEDLLNNNPYEQLQKNVANFLSLILDFPTRMEKKIDALLEGQGQDIGIRIRDTLIKYLKEQAFPVILDKILTNVTKYVGPILMECITPNPGGPEQDESESKMRAVFLDEKDGILIAIRDKIEADVLKTIGDLIGTQLTVDKQKTLQQNVKENLRHVFENLVRKVVNTLTDGIMNVEEFKNFIKGDVKDTIIQNLKTAATEAGKALTTAALDSITGLLGAKVTVDKVNGHKFTTQAIAGASGQQVAVAGSVAVAVINGDTTAVIKGADAASPYVVSATNDIIVKAEANHVEKTVASAAEDSRGEADANENAGASAGTAGGSSQGGTDKTISNSVINWGNGGTTSISERTVQVTPDADKKIKSIKVTYTKPDKTKGETQLALTQTDMLNGYTFAVPETGDPKAAGAGNSYPINNLGGRYVEVLTGSTIEYVITFISRDSQTMDVIDLIWTGGGEGTITKRASEGSGTGGENIDDSIGDDVKWKEKFYNIKVTPDEYYKLQDDYLTFKFTTEKDKDDHFSIKMTESLITDGYPISVLTCSDGRVLVKLSTEKWYWLKKGTSLQALVDFVGKFRITVKQGGISNGEALDEMTVNNDVIDPSKKEQNSDGTYTNSYTVIPNADRGTVKVRDLAAEKDGDILRAAYEDLIAVTVIPKEGCKFYKLFMIYKDEEGHDKRQMIVTKDSSIIDPDGGTTFVFYLPKSDTVVVAVFLEKAAGEQDPPEEPEKTASGKTIGVGAAFAMTYSDVNVNAGIGKNRKVTAGAVDVRATSIHNASTSGTAGSDPLATASKGTQSETTKDVSLDAGASLTILSDEVKATIGAGSVLTIGGRDSIAVDPADPGSKYVSFNLLADQSGQTNTKASAFAAGKSTAVGASVTVNIVDSLIEAVLDGTVSTKGAANVAARTYNRDNSEALATAMGADLDRYLNKFATGVDNIEKKANKLLAGDYFTLGGSNGGGGTSGGGSSSNGNKEKANTTLNKNKKDGGGTDNNANLSSNVLASQNVKIPTSGGNAANKGSEGAGKAGEASGKNFSDNQKNGGDEQSFQVAAAVGLNITKHKAHATVNGSLTAATIDVASVNRGNFLTKGTGIAMSLGRKSNSIAAGVAVSVNKNETITLINGSLIAKDQTEEKGDVSITAKTTQNMDGKYRGLLAAQALAGAVSGADGTISLAGSVVVVVDDAETAVKINKDNNKEVKIEGAKITIEAYDKTKLAVRAGGVSISKGSKVGVGVAFSLIYANESVDVYVGNGTKIVGESLEINSEKARVDFSDYTFALGVQNFITDTSDLSATEKATAKKGFVNLDRDKTKDNAPYTIDININTSDALALVDALNVLSSTNYYLEAVAGSIMGSQGADSTLSLAGSVAMLFFKNKVNATIGNNVTIDLSGSTYKTWKDRNDNVWYIRGDDVFVLGSDGLLRDAGFKAAVLGAAKEGTEAYENKKTETIDGAEYTLYTVGSRVFYVYKVSDTQSRVYEKSGGKLKTSDITWSMLNASETTDTLERGMNFRAFEDANIRIIAGSVSVSPSKAGVGLTVAYIQNEDEVKATVGTNSKINVAVNEGEKGGYIQTASFSADILLVTVAAAISSSSSSKFNLGGAFNVAAIDNLAEASVGAGTVITARDDVRIMSSVDTNEVLVSLSAAGGAGDVAVGATVAVVLDNAEATTKIGKAARLESLAGSVTVESKNYERLINVLASASAAPAGKAAAAGSIGVLISGTKAGVDIAEEATIVAEKDVNILTDTESMLVEVGIGVSVGGSTAAVGASVLVNILNREATIVIHDGVTITATTGNVLIQSTGADENIIIGLAVAATQGNGITGTIPVLVSNTKIENVIGDKQIEKDDDDDDLASTATGSGKTINITAGDSIGVFADLDTQSYMFAGG
ncbi:MAG: hypothetical protein IJM62_00105, partial [Lachnospiraceae bacterium]|nr:hypothetical protein [Lachnospiraceae bacterium]